MWEPTAQLGLDCLNGLQTSPRLLWLWGNLVTKVLTTCNEIRNYVVGLWRIKTLTGIARLASCIPHPFPYAKSRVSDHLSGCAQIDRWDVIFPPGLFKISSNCFVPVLISEGFKLWSSVLLCSHIVIVLHAFLAFLDCWSCPCHFELSFLRFLHFLCNTRWKPFEKRGEKLKFSESSTIPAPSTL